MKAGRGRLSGDVRKHGKKVFCEPENISCGQYDCFTFSSGKALFYFNIKSRVENRQNSYRDGVTL